MLRLSKKTVRSLLGGFVLIACITGVGMTQAHAGCTYNDGCQAKEYNAGPIADGDAARITCPKVCQNAGRIWTSEWHTTIPDKMSVCGCACTGFDLPANDYGPFHNNADAKAACPTVCDEQGMDWNGNWKTNSQNWCGCDCKTSALKS